MACLWCPNVPFFTYFLQARVLLCPQYPLGALRSLSPVAPRGAVSIHFPFHNSTCIYYSVLAVLFRAVEGVNHPPFSFLWAVRILTTSIRLMPASVSLPPFIGFRSLARELLFILGGGFIHRRFYPSF
jgi:hypothetical protein